MINRLLFKNIDNSALVVFRIFFGLLIFLESVGAIFTGWVNRVLIEPQFTFSFIGFEWLQPLPGQWMYMYYVVMGVFGLLVMLGYKYRLSIIAFTVMWTGTYIMQKTSYNNHYYLLILLSTFMAVVPANRYLSIDVKLNPTIQRNSMPQWCSLIFILQMWIVYTYASLAKIYPDWLDTSVADILMQSKSDYYLIGDVLQQKWLHYFITYLGIIFDLLIVPLLLWKPTRKYAFFAAIIFHIFNSIVFQVGIFPFLSLALCLFFFEPKTIKDLFLKKKEYYNEVEVAIQKKSVFISTLFLLYFIVQIVLPLRHWTINSEVLWTEEGHRMSWRMMLRSKSGTAFYKVIDKANGQTVPIKLEDYLTRKQMNAVSTKPDVIWQFSQYLKQNFEDKGKDVSVYVDCRVKVNGKPFQQLIDPEVDMATAKWNIFKHNDWILPRKQD